MNRYVKEALLAYAPAFVAPALWGFVNYPEQLRWTGDVSAQVFSLLAGIYDGWTEVEGYGEPLEQALMDLRSEPTRVLDIATGTGYVARRIKERYPSAEVIGVDVSSEMVAVAEENAAEEGLDIEFRAGDAADLPFPADTFDLVVMQNALPFVDEMLRVTEPRGRALLVFSVAGPWVSLVWPSIASSFEKAGAAHLRTRRIAYGFFALARKRG